MNVIVSECHSFEYELDIFGYATKYVLKGCLIHIIFQNGVLQVCLELEAAQLHVCVVSGEGLSMVETEDTISLPAPYVVTRLSTAE